MDNKRIFKLDLIRVFAILYVVLCHSVESIYDIHTQKSLFMTIGFTIGRLGVPLFLFLTGALLLSRDYDNDKKILGFYKDKLLPIFIAYELWVVIYNIFFGITDPNYYFQIKDIIKELLFLQSLNIPHIWYIPMIMGIYLVLPFISKIVKNFSFKSLLPAFIFILIVTIIIPTLQTIIPLFTKEMFDSIFPKSTFGGLYCLYVIIGYYLSKYINKIKII